jgi:hypothetical protein
MCKISLILRNSITSFQLSQNKILPNLCREIWFLNNIYTQHSPQLTDWQHREKYSYSCCSPKTQYELIARGVTNSVSAQIVQENFQEPGW